MRGRDRLTRGESDQHRNREPPEHCPIGELLATDGENSHLEHKSTLRTGAESGEIYKPLETACSKTVAGYANSRDGGTLLIGVADDGSVHGLISDYASSTRTARTTATVSTST